MYRIIKKDILTLVATVAMVFAGSGCPGKEGAEKMQAAEQKKAEVYSRYPAKAWEKMPEPKPGDWLYWRKEPGQTFEEYKRQLHGKKADSEGVIYLQPLGEIDTETAALFEKMREFTSIYFDRETRLQKPMPIPKQAYNRRRRQYNGSVILKQLRREIPGDALARVGITMKDLYSGDLNFVFGLGSPQLKAGIYSLHRYTQTYPGCKPYNTLLRRALKVIAHEIGHIFFVEHCIFYRCIMNGSNSLPEADSRPMALCPVDEEKLRHCLGYDRAERYRKLERFYHQNELTRDADFIKRIQVRIKRRK